MVCPLDQVNDTEIMIFSASQLSDIGDLSALKVGYAEFVYATKLQRLVLGNSSQYYSNGNLQTLYLGQNKLLKLLDVRNCTGLGTGDQKTVDLSGCTGIEEVYFDGTNITGVTLPNGGVLRVLHLPSTITALTIRNQPSLIDFTCPSLSGITTLWLENVGDTVDTRSILESLRTGARVRIFGFLWNLDYASEISDMFDILDDMRGLDQNGDNMDSAQVYGTIHVPSITGDVIAHANARYPDITISYDHVSAILTYLDNDGTQLAQETILDGAAPAHTPNLSTKEDSQYYYTFLGWGTSAGGPVVSDIFNNITADTTVYAVYSMVAKIFTVRFFNGSELLATFTNVAYGADVEYSETPIYNGVGNPGDYVFNGWSPMPENIVADTDCYAQFEFVGMYFRQYLEDSLTYYEENTLTSIGSHAFAGLTNLAGIKLGALLSIPEGCFKGTSSLVSVDLPAALATNSSAFTTNAVMTSLLLPEVTLLNRSPLVSGMTALKELRLPKNTSSLSSMITSCSNIELVDIGVTATIGQNLNVSNFGNLKYLIMRNTSQVVTPYGSTIFRSASPLGKGTGKIMVPSSMVASYKADTTWSKYAAMIEAIEDNPEICG